MERNLRVLNAALIPQKRDKHRVSRALVVLTVIGLIYQLFMGGNVTRVLFGVAPNIRFSPANILMLFVAFYALAAGPIPIQKFCRQSPGLIIYFCTIPLFMFYTAFFNGFSGAAFYFDSFWGPAFLAITLECVSDRQQRFIGKFLLVVVLLNAVFGLGESLTHSNLFPFVNDDAMDAKQIAKELQISDDFRANAFYFHPLTASLITAMGLFMALAMQLRFWIMAPSFVLIFLALLAFGGRTALVVAGVALCLTSSWIVLSGLLRRTLQLSTISYVALTAVTLPLLIGYVVTQTSIADRIVDTFYMDDSAEVRIIQWHVLRYLSLKNWLFGVPMDELLALKYQVGITGVEDIENFWLLIFLNLGAIGFLAFLLVFGMFLVANYAGGLYGWVLMLVGLIIDSGANSLGTKSNDLVIEVAMARVRRLPALPSRLQGQDASGIVSSAVHPHSADGRMAPAWADTAGRSSARSVGCWRTSASACATTGATSSFNPCCRPDAYSWLQPGWLGNCENRV
jgi:hypothetical protein